MGAFLTRVVKQSDALLAIASRDRVRLSWFGGPLPGELSKYLCVDLPVH